MADAAPSLQRRIGISDAVVVGLGAMLGAGVFAAFAPAAAAAGTGPRAVNVLGLVGCLVLVGSLPVLAVGTG